MKSILLLIVCVLSFSSSSVAQATETFDIATFQPPKGWQRQDKGGVVLFNTTNEQKGTYAMIMLFTSGTSTGNSKSDFDGDWQEFIAGQLRIKGKPELEPVVKMDGWDVVSGGAAFENETGPSAVILRTYSGFGKTFSAAAIFNSQGSVPAIEAFASSIKLKKSQAVSPQAPAIADSNAASILGTWGRTVSDQSSYAVRNAVQNHLKREYTFNADGTYRFISKAFDPFSTKLLFGKETGTYRVSGDLLTINPKTSVLEGWSKKNGGSDWGSRLDSQNRKLETVTYRFTKHYFAGIQTTSLILIADQVTQRDGPFSGDGGFDNVWIYSPPCEKCFIEMPR